MSITSELPIPRRPDASLSAALRAYGHGVTVLAPSQAVTITTTALLALSDSPDGYATTLSAMAFPGPLREAWARARGQAKTEGVGMHLRVRIDDPTGALHALRGELPRDPLTQTPLARQESGALARLIASDSLHAPDPPAKPDLRALIAVAGPSDCAPWTAPSLRPSTGTTPAPPPTPSPTTITAPTPCLTWPPHSPRPDSSPKPSPSSLISGTAPRIATSCSASSPSPLSCSAPTPRWAATSAPASPGSMRSLPSAERPLGSFPVPRAWSELSLGRQSFMTCNN